MHRTTFAVALAATFTLTSLSFGQAPKPGPKKRSATPQQKPSAAPPKEYTVKTDVVKVEVKLKGVVPKRASNTK